MPGARGGRASRARRPHRRGRLRGGGTGFSPCMGGLSSLHRPHPITAAFPYGRFRASSRKEGTSEGRWSCRRSRTRTAWPGSSPDAVGVISWWFHEVTSHRLSCLRRCPGLVYCVPPESGLGEEQQLDSASPAGLLGGVRPGPCTAAPPSDGPCAVRVPSVCPLCVFCRSRSQRDSVPRALVPGGLCPQCHHPARGVVHRDPGESRSHGTLVSLLRCA